MYIKSVFLTSSVSLIAVATLSSAVAGPSVKGVHKPTIATHSLSKAFASKTFGKTVAPSAAAIATMPKASAAPAVYDVVSQFRGISLVDTIALGTGEIPPDMGAATNNSQVLQVINGGFAIYDTSGKLLRKQKTDSGFWAAAGIKPDLLAGGVSDPRIIYDSTVGRFIIVQINLIAAAITGNPDDSTTVFIGVSKTSDPRQGFRATTAMLKKGILGDFPTLGVNGDAVTLAFNNFDISGSFTDMSAFSIPKADLLLPKPSAKNITKFDTLATDDVPGKKGYGFTLQAANSLDPGTGKQVVVGIGNTRFNEVRLSTITGGGAAGATISPAVTIRTKYSGVIGQGRQPGGLFFGYDNSDDRISSKVKQVGKYLYVVNTASDSQSSKTPTHNSVHIMVIDTSNNTVAVDRLITDPTGKLDYSYPSIDANANGRFVVAYNGSGPNSNISAYATVCDFDATTNANSCSSPSLVYAGLESDYDLGFFSVRWGDYSAVQLDPDNANGFWLYQEVPIEKQLDNLGFLNARWGTVMTHIITR